MELVFGGDANFPPYEYLDANGEPAGLNVDLIRAIGRLHRLPVRFSLGPWPQVRAGLQSGRVNVAAMYRSTQREHEVDFAIPHELIYHEMFVRRGSEPVLSLGGLQGKHVLVQADTFSADALSALGVPLTMHPVASEPEALESLASGQGNVAVVTQATGRPFRDRLHLAERIVPTGPPVLLTEYAFVTVRGRRDLTELLSQGVASLKTSGEYDRIYERWLRPDRSAQLAGRIAWALAAALLAVLLVVLWNRALRRRVALQTQALRREFEEKARAQAALEEFERHLRQSQKLEAVGQLAGGIAHDFNNILTAMLMQLNLLREDREASERIRKRLKDIEDEADRAANLTRQLLLFSRRQAPDTRALDLNSLLGNLLKMLRRLIGAQTTLEFNGFPGDLWVEADPGMLEQVVVNLVVNARDAMPRGGRITLATRLDWIEPGDGQRHPEAYPGRFVSLAIRDQGCGMDAEVLKRIFEPFFTTKPVGKGTGLGLATVFGIVKQHRGWIEVETAPGQGSTFTVRLPSGSRPPAEPLAAGPGLSGGHERLLVVEDEPAVRRSLSAMLRQLGYQVCETGSAQEALQAWDQLGGLVDLLITDMVMPGERTGLDLIAELRRRRPGLKAILMSGYSPEIAEQGLPRDPDTLFLQKPFEAGRLGRLLRESLDPEDGGGAGS